MGVEERIIGGGEESSSPTGKVKFFCSNGGKILPRPSDGALKYIGGETRVIGIPRSMTFLGLMKKISELFEGDYVLKYQIAMEDLDSLVSVKSDEDLRHMLDEYDRLESEGTTKLRTFLFPIKPIIIESHSTLSGLGPHAVDQRFVDAINGIVRPVNFGAKPSLNTSRLMSFSPSPTESSPQSLSPRSTTSANSSAHQENSLISSLQSRLARVHRVQSSPSLCNLVGLQNSATLLANNYLHPRSNSNYFPTQQHQHFHHGCQTPNIQQDHHINNHHSYQSPSTLHDHFNHNHHRYQSPTKVLDYQHILPSSQPLMTRSDYGKVPQTYGPTNHHNSSYYNPLLRKYPGSGGHNKWGHLEQYETPSNSSSHFVRASSHSRNSNETWE